MDDVDLHYKKDVSIEDIKKRYKIGDVLEDPSSGESFEYTDKYQRDLKYYNDGSISSFGNSNFVYENNKFARIIVRGKSLESILEETMRPGVWYKDRDNDYFRLISWEAGTDDESRFRFRYDMCIQGNDYNSEKGSWLYDLSINPKEIPKIVSVKDINKILSSINANYIETGETETFDEKVKENDSILGMYGTYKGSRVKIIAVKDPKYLLIDCGDEGWPISSGDLSRYNILKGYDQHKNCWSVVTQELEDISSNPSLDNKNDYLIPIDPEPIKDQSKEKKLTGNKLIPLISIKKRAII